MMFLLIIAAWILGVILLGMIFRPKSSSPPRRIKGRRLYDIPKE